MDGFIATMVAVSIFCFGLLAGSTLTGDAWESDCKLLGMHQAKGVAYQCKLSSPHPSQDKSDQRIAP
jgi:hypothetical protein